ncbi:MAG: deoxyribose-phosphate aldolase [candidate division Zixibacteria bacterium]
MNKSSNTHIELSPALFDHTALGANVTEGRIPSLCREAVEHNLHAVCVNPTWVQKAAGQLLRTPVSVVSVVGFPLGANRTDMKVREAVMAAEDGAREIDMVANIGWIIDQKMKPAVDEIRDVRKALPENIILKVIIEASLLSELQLKDAVCATIDGGAEFVKSSTGYAGDVTVAQVRAMSTAASGQIAIKAAGGIKTAAQCRELLLAGASRLGCSGTMAIMRELS